MSRLSKLLKHEAAGGVVLLIAAVLALTFSNTALKGLYDSLLNVPVTLRIGTFAIDKPLLLWINDGLMAVFFFVVGLEIKRELLQGRLATWQQASLPLVGAAGGVILPAAIYAAINLGDPVAINGWAIPAATDIAFAVGLLALLGTRAPTSLKIFLLALAIIDDLAAIVIIALFYTADLSTPMLAGALGCLAVLTAMNLAGVRRPAFYVLIGLVMWACVLKSGVHATLAGVALAFTIPLQAPAGAKSLAKEMEHALHPWSAFFVMPVFAFANAGVSLAGLSLADMAAPIPLGIAVGLFVGKQLGIFAFALAGARLRICAKPADASWLQLYGVAVLAGIGFTMSLFIGTLAFADPALAAQVRLGVLAGSIASALVGLAILAAAAQPRPAHAAV